MTTLRPTKIGNASLEYTETTDVNFDEDYFGIGSAQEDGKTVKAKGWVVRDAIAENLFGVGFDETFPFATSGVLTAAMDGGTVNNQDATTPITLTMMDAVAGRAFAVNRREFYNIIMEPAGSDSIRGSAGNYTIITSFYVFFNCLRYGEWEVAFKDGDDEILNVKAFGAVGDGVTDDTVAFQRAYSNLVNPYQTVEIPATDSEYIITGDFFQSIPPTTDSAYPPTRIQLGTTLWAGKVACSVPLVVPHQHVIRGPGRRVADSEARGSLRATSDFVDDGTPLLRMGNVTNEIVHGIAIEELHMHAPANTAMLAIQGDGLQEGCHLRGLIIQGFNQSVNFRYGDTGVVDGRCSNFIVEDCEFYNRTDATEPPFFLYNSGGPTIIRRCTASSYGTDDTADFVPAFRLTGRNILAQALHGEYCSAVVELGATVLDSNGDPVAALQSKNISLDNISATHPAGIDACPAVVHIVENGTNNRVSSVSMRNLTAVNNVTNIIIDEGDAPIGRPALTLNATDHPALLHYELGEINAGMSYAPFTTSSAFTGTRSNTFGAGNTDDFNPTFAGYLRATANAAGTSAIRSILGGFYGRKLFIINETAAGAYNLTLTHNTGGTAEARIWCSTGGNIVLAQYEAAVLEYGVGINARWFAHKL